MEAKKLAEIEGAVTNAEPVDLFPGHQEWIKALRSKKFEQGRGTYRRRRIVHTYEVYAYCALGVYMNAMDLKVTDEPLMELLPEGLPHKIVDMNDKQRLSFAVIADWLENLEGK